MKKTDWVDRIAEAAEVTKAQARRMLDAQQGIVEGEMRERGVVRLFGLGAFDVLTSAPRIGHNPKTLEKVKIPAKRRVRFVPSKLMRATVAQAA